MTEPDSIARLIKKPTEKKPHGIEAVANLEAGATDVKCDNLNAALKKETEINAGFSRCAAQTEASSDLYEGVTDNAPYQNTSDYKMVAYLADDENENKKDLFNTHSS